MRMPRIHFAPQLWLGLVLLIFALLLELVPLAGAEWSPAESKMMSEHPTPVRFSRTIGSVAQTRITLRLMRDIVRRSAYDPVVIEAAERAVADASGRDERELAGAIDSYLTDHLSFLPDGLIQGEILRTPRYLIDRIGAEGKARADCEDGSMLAAALATCVGLPARFVALAFFDASRPFAHVFAEVKTQDGWVPIDPTEPNRGGMRELPVTRRMELAV